MPVLKGIIATHDALSSNYLLANDSQLSTSDLKILQGLDSARLMKCYCSRFNGRFKLTYFSEGERTLSSCLAYASPAQAIKAFVNALKAVLEIERNGFLSSLKIDTTPESIRINPADCSVRIVYLPVTFDVLEGGERATFEQLCQSFLWTFGQHRHLVPLVQTVSGYIGSSGGQIEGLLAILVPRFDLDVGAIPVASFDDGPEISSVLIPEPPPERIKPWKLVGTIAGNQVELRVFPGSVIVGKSRTKADIQIVGVPTVSNRHCRLDLDENGLRVCDLNSRNGTFVNGSRIAPEASTPLRSGDLLSLSEAQFRVQGVS